MRHWIIFWISNNCVGLCPRSLVLPLTRQSEIQTERRHGGERDFCCLRTPGTSTTRIVVGVISAAVEHHRRHGGERECFPRFLGGAQAGDNPDQKSRATIPCSSMSRFNLVVHHFFICVPNSLGGQGRERGLNLASYGDIWDQIQSVWAFIFQRRSRIPDARFTPDFISSHWGSLGRLGELILMLEMFFMPLDLKQTSVVSMEKGSDIWVLLWCLWACVGLIFL